ncbi:MAG: hypothetical protein A2054_03765 [Deltaproteobacteria bacterium GWA2_55_10]|nr:MAG: hypothetical protein A2054_03765 [Deltaproteobacteria bacterium GWA2_55_10]
MRSVVLITAIILVFASVCKAEEKGRRYMTGIVSGLDGAALVVNERHRVVLTYSTGVWWASGMQAGQYDLDTGKWVYVEGAVNTDGSIDAEKIYILPGPAGRKGGRKYDFIQSP